MIPKHKELIYYFKLVYFATGKPISHGILPLEYIILCILARSQIALTRLGEVHMHKGISCLQNPRLIHSR
jgi:hypothetical protein